MPSVWITSSPICTMPARTLSYNDSRFVNASSRMRSSSSRQDISGEAGGFSGIGIDSFRLFCVYAVYCTLHLVGRKQFFLREYHQTRKLLFDKQSDKGSEL